MGPRSYPSGSFVPETITTSFSFLRSDRPVYATALVRSVGPCQPTSAMAGRVFSYLRNPYPSVSGGIYDLYGRLHSNGAPIWGFPNFGYLDLSGPRAPYQLLGAQGGSGHPTSLGFSAPGPPGHDSYGQFDGSFLYQQARRDPVQYLVAYSNGAFYVVTSSEHSNPSKTHSRLSERDSRPPISSQSADNDRVESPFRNRESKIRILGDSSSGHVCNSFKLPPSSVHVSNSGATGSGGGCSVSGLAGKIDVHVSIISPVQQSYSETTGHTGSRGNSNSPLVAETAVVSTPTSSLCGPPSVLSIPLRSSVSTGSEIRLGRKFVPSARMEALVQHYKAAGFSARSLGLPQHLGDPQPIACMTIGGFTSLAGPQGRDLISA